jgi:hypothetical protein
MGWRGLDWPGSGYGPVESSFEYGNEPLGSIQFRDIKVWLHNCWPLE